MIVQGIGGGDGGGGGGDGKGGGGGRQIAPSVGQLQGVPGIRIRMGVPETVAPT